MAEPHPPASPTHTSTSSYSLIQSIDNLSLSTGSFDLISNQSSPSLDYNPSHRSHSSHSRQSSGSLLSAPHQPGDDRRSSLTSEEDVVVLPPRSLASSMSTGASSLGRLSRGSTPLTQSPNAKGGAVKKEVGEGITSATPTRVKTEPIDFGDYVYGTASTSAPPSVALTKQEMKKIHLFSKQKAKKLIRRRKELAAMGSSGGSAASSEAWTAEEEEEMEEHYERFKREKTNRKLKLKVKERAAGGASTSTSDAGSMDTGSYSGISSGDAVKIEKGKGKAKGKGKKVSPSTPKKDNLATTYNISGTPRVIDRTARDLLTGVRGTDTPPPTEGTTAKLQQASLQKLHLLEVLRNGSEGGSSSGDSRDEEDEDDSEEDEEDEDEVDDALLSNLRTPAVYMDIKGERPGRSAPALKPVFRGMNRKAPSTSTGSIISAEDARSSLDSFLLDPTRHIGGDEKLRIWQSLCYELGLADLDEDDYSLPDLPGFSTAPTAKSSPSSSRISTPTQLSRPMPQTLGQARNLLKSEGHVNIAEYLDARANHNAGVSEDEDDGDETERESSGGRRHNGRYGYLVHETTRDMMKYTFKSKKFAKLEVVKAEVMQPLLRDFGFKRGRARREGMD